MLTLVLVTHEKKMLEVECDSVTLPGSEGYLGVLPGHTPLISALKPGRLTYSAGGKEQSLVVSAGFCEVSSDIVTVLADAAESPDSIDVPAARAMLEDAEQALGDADAEELETLQERLALAQARIEVGGG